MQFKFVGHNWWSRKIYRNKNGTPICELEEGFYSLSDPEDIDSEPCSRLNKDKIEIVEEFT